MNKINLALITGPSSGIGTAFAQQLAKGGADLIFVSRSEKKLQELAENLKAEYNNNIWIFPCDLAQPGSAQSVLEFCESHKLEPDLLINNAGFGYQGFFEDSELSFYDDMMQLNMNTLTDLSYLFGKKMIQKKNGGILNIASVAGGQPVPYFSVYAATKSYVIDFSVALWREWKEHNVHVTCLCPGPVDTNFFEVSGANPREMMLRKLQTPEEVAAIGLKAIYKNKPYLTTSTSLGITKWVSGKLSPKTVANTIERTMKPKKK